MSYNLPMSRVDFEQWLEEGRETRHSVGANLKSAATNVEYLLGSELQKVSSSRILKPEEPLHYFFQALLGTNDEVHEDLLANVTKTPLTSGRNRYGLVLTLFAENPVSVEFKFTPSQNWIDLDLSRASGINLLDTSNPVVSLKRDWINSARLLEIIVRRIALAHDGGAHRSFVRESFGGSVNPVQGYKLHGMTLGVARTTGYEL